MAIDLVATLRLQDNMTSALNRAQGRVESMTSRMNILGRNPAFNGLTAQVGGFVAALGSAVGAQKLFNATILEAAQFEQASVLVEAMFDDTKASKQYAQMVEEMALASPIMDSSTMMGNSKAFVSITKDLPTLERAWGIAEKLSILDPEQGLKGAIYAMKELASGDGVSMAQRFEMPKKVVNDIKKLPFDQQLTAMQDYLDTTGITSKTVARMGETTLAKWGGVQERLTSAFRQFGSDGNSALSKALDGILAGMDSGAFDGLIKAVDSSLGKAVTSMTAWIQKVDWQSVATNAQNAFTTMTNAVATAATFIKTHWDTIVFATKAVVTAFVGLKAISFAIGVFATVSSAVGGAIRIFNSLKTAVTIARTAFTLLRAGMLLFPGTWIIAAIGAVIAIGIALYKNWDTVKAKTAQLWAKFKETSAFKAMQSGLEKLIGVAKKVVDGFNGLRSGISNAMEKAKSAVFSSINGIIDKVNWLIEKLNAIPGVNVPLVAHVSYSGPSPGEMSAVNGESLVRNSGPMMIGHHGGWNEIRTDRTPRLLHAGERVLTAVENDNYKQMMSSGLPGAIARMSSLKPAAVQGDTTTNNYTDAVSNIDNRTTNAFELPPISNAPILRALSKVTTPTTTFNWAGITEAINRVAKRAINVVIPQDNSAGNVITQLRDVISGAMPSIPETDSTAISNSVSNSSVSNVANTSNSSTVSNSSTSTRTISPTINLGGIKINGGWDLNNVSDRKAVAGAISQEVATSIAQELEKY